MENIQYISLDILDNHVYDSIFTKQYDVGRQIEFAVTEDGEPYDLTGILVSFQMKKPDNTVVLVNCTNVDKNKVQVTLDREMTTMYGNRVPYQLQLIKDDKAFTTINGYMQIEKSVVQREDIESKDEFGTLTDVLVKFNELNEKFEKSHFVVVSDTQPDDLKTNDEWFLFYE